MSIKTTKNAVALAAGALGVAGAVAIATASPSWAALVASNTAAVRTAASNQVTDVQYHRRGYHGRAMSTPTLTHMGALISASVGGW
jgi:hypothetical protein